MYIFLENMFNKPELVLRKFFKDLEITLSLLFINASMYSEV